MILIVVDHAKTVLVTAGNGNQARSVIPRLAAAGFRVRAMRRTNRAGPGPADLGAHEVVVADASRPGDAFDAMQGVDAVYHVGPSFHPHEREMGFNMIEQAQRCGVRHFVFSSVLHPILTGLPQHLIKRDIEERLVQSGLGFTVLQPADYMQMAALGVLADRSQFVLGWDLDRRQAMVDLDDVAEVAVTVLSEGERHDGATYELACGDNLTAHDLAAALTEVFGRPFTARRYVPSYEPAPEIFGYYDEAHTRHQMEVYKVVNDWYDRHDFVGNGNVLGLLLGRRPTSFAEFARKHFGLGT